MDTLFDDIRYSIRALRAAPGFTAITVLSLALAIGSTTAVFGVLDALLLRPLAVPRPAELITLEQVEQRGGRFRNLSLFDRDRLASLLSADRPVVTDIAAVTWADGFDPASGESARVSLVTGNYFRVMDLRPRAGRLIAPADDEGDGQPVAVISDRFWRRRYGDSSDAVGRSIVLNGTGYRIVGIASRGFAGDWVGWPTDVWLPSAMAPRIMGMAGGSGVRMRLQYKLLARLAPAVTPPQAAVALAAAYRQIQLDPPAASGVVSGARLDLVPAANGYSPQRESFVQPLAILMAIAIVVLLIACSNTANLVLARAAMRSREIAVRFALGAPRRRVIRLLVTESALVSLIACGAGLLLAGWGGALLLAIVRSSPVVSVMSGIPTADLEIAPDARVIAFTMLLFVLTTVLTGLTPAFRGSRLSASAALIRRGVHDRGGRTGGPRAALLVVQIAASLVLLIGTALLVRTLSNLRTQDLGFERGDVTLVWTAPNQTGRDPESALELWRIVQDRVARTPGVVSASASVEGVLTGASGGGPRLVGDLDPERPVRAEATSTVAPGFFQTIGQPLVSGREFNWQDTATAPPVAILNALMARRLFGDTPAVGRRIRIAGSELPPMEVVGVVQNARMGSPRATPPAIYYPAAQNVRRVARAMCLVVRSDIGAASLAPRLRAAVHDVDPRLPVVRIDSVDGQLESALYEERLLTGLSLFLAAIAALMTGIGLYGIVAFLAARRTGEFGVRLALGATPASVVCMMLKESSAIALAGVALGLPLTALATRWLGNRLFGVAAADPASIAAAILIMAAVVALGAIVPARRAARVDPMAALRSE